MEEGSLDTIRKAKKALWSIIPLRAWYRAQYGVALTLRKLGRYDEAVIAWEELQRMDDGRHGSHASYVNVFAIAPECIFGCGISLGPNQGDVSFAC